MQQGQAEASLRETDGEDLFNTLSKELSVPNSATLRVLHQGTVVDFLLELHNM